MICRNINLTIEEGKALCLLGRNGVGKTTLLQTIMGLNPTVEGEARLEKDLITGLKPFQIANFEVAYAPQTLGVFPELTVEQNLKIGQSKKKRSSSNDLKEVFDHFPIIKERLKQRAGTLSGGETKMLIMSRCILRNPKLLVLDEITEGVQPSIVETISEAIKQLIQKGTTILIVEQNVNFALAVSDTYAVMNQGEIIEVGEIDADTKSRVEKHLTL